MPMPFRTRYGHFSADGREYVITRPDTPRPWVNVICPAEYGTVVSQAGTGYSWQTHASFNRLTRWEQDLVRDEWGKFIYCRDRGSGARWSLAWQPVRARPQRYECRHGVGYTRITSLHHDIESELLVFVPPADPLELWRIRLHNRSRRRRRLDLCTYLEWNLGPAPDTHREFHRLFIETEVVRGARAMLATKRLTTIPEHHHGEPWNTPWPHVAFHAASLPLRSWESDKERFLGRYGSLADPAALHGPRLSGTTGKWQDGIGALQVEVDLAPAGQREITFSLGMAATRAKALGLARKYRAPRAVERAFAATRRHWEALLAPLEVKTPDPAFDLLTNVWLKYQAISCRIRGRTGYFQPGGAFGFRDQLQDCQVFLPLATRHARRQIELHAAHQFEDGTVWHWWHPLTEEGLRKPFNDDLLWLPFVTLNYLLETADFDFLERRIPFLRPDGRRGSARGTLYEHCRRAIDSFGSRLSPRGLPRIGAGDWNDGLSHIGRRHRAESVWLAHFLIMVLERWVELEGRRKRPDQAVIRRYTAQAAAMRVAVNRHGWDGGWYLGATKDSGEPVGSRRNREGRIFLNSQTWAILSGVAPPPRVRMLQRAMEKHLYRDYGPLLLAPAYRRPDPDIGYLTRYAPGARENGGLYTHAATWAIQAECVMGRRGAAWRLYQRLSPVRRGMQPDLYQVEPYVTPGNVDGPDSPHYGRGGWTWYTGSAAWLFRVSTEWILGVRPEWDGLRIRPCLPPGWKGFTVRRRFRGADYDIAVTAGRGPREVRVDGAPQATDLIAAFADGRTHRVQVRVPGSV